MNPQRGKNGGLSGVVSVSGTPKFNVAVFQWQEMIGVQALPVEGRGDATPWVPTMAVRPGGTIVMTGIAQFRQPPLPSAFKGQEGTLTLVLTKTAKQTVSVRIDSAKITLAKDAQDGWLVGLTATILSDPVQTGFDTDAPDATDPAALAKETFAGLSKLYDPKNLIDEGTRSFFMAPLANTDDAERAYLATLIAAAVAPFDGAKPKFGRLEMGRSFNTGVFTLQFAHTDTEEDVVNPGTVTTTDSNLLESQAVATGVFSPPADPGGDFVEQTTTTQEIHDGATKTVINSGLLDTKEKVEFPGTVTDNDLYDLADSATVTIVHNSATIPADPTAPLGVLLSRETLRINRYRWQTVFKYGNTTSAQRITFPSSPIEDCPSELTDEDKQSFITTSSTAPAAPTPRIADLQLRRTTSTRISGTPEQWEHVFTFARNTPADDVRIRGEHTDADPNDLGETAVVRRVTNSETPPATPSAPVGQLIESTTEPLTVVSGAYTGRWVHTFKYGPNTKLQDIEFDGDTIVDPSTIKMGQVIPVVDDDSTPPATPTPANTDLKLVRRRTRRIQGTPEKWVHVFEFGRNTNEDELEHKKRAVDPDDFGETERIPILHTSETSSPGTPTQIGTTSNLIGTEVDRLCVPSGSFTGLWLWTFMFGPSTRKQEMEQEGGVSADPDLLDDDDVQTLTHTSSTNPGTPAARVTGQVLMKRTFHRTQNTPEKWEHKYYFGYRTVATKMEADKTETTTDISALRSKASTGDVWLVSDGAPATPTLSGFKLREHTDLETNNPLYRFRVYEWGLTTVEEDIELPGTSVEYDPLKNISRVETTVETDATSIVTIGETFRDDNKSDPTVGRFKIERLNDGKVKKIIEYLSLTENLRCRTYGGYKHFETRFTGSAIQVYVSQVIERGGGVFEALITPQLLWYAEMDFVFRKRRDRVYLPTFFEKLGTRNNADFIGIPAGYATFLGAEIETERSLDTPHVMDSEFNFRFSSRGLYEATGVCMGWITTDADVSVGWTDVGDFGWGGGPLPGSNYDDFFT